MSTEELKLLTDWIEENKDHKLNFLEKEAIKMAVKRDIYHYELPSTKGML